ncbi:MAG: autotransporter assembly complex family protein [Nitrospirota bacterium]
MKRHFDIGMHFFLRIACILITLFFKASLLLANEVVEVSIQGLEGEILENVQAALTIPQGIVEDGKVNMPWLDYFKEQADKKVRTAMEPFGYYNPQIKVTLETVAEERYRLVVNVEPGEQVRLTEVKISLLGPGAKEESLSLLVSAFPLQKGDVLLQKEYEKAKGGLKAKAVELGYLDADFSMHRILVSRSESNARIELELETGPKYFFGDTNFEGAPEYPDRFLRRYLTYKAGEVFSYGKLGETQLNIVNSERFREVIITAEKDKTEELRVPVLIRLQSSPPKSFRTGIGYGTDTGGRVTLGYKDLNFFQKGHELHAEVNISQRLIGLGAGYIIPGLQNINNLSSFQLNLQQEDVDTYKTRLISLEANSIRSFGKGRLRTIYLRLLKEKSTIASEEINSFLILPGIRFSEQRYDDLIRPSRGHRYALEVRGASKYLGSDTNLMQFLVDANAILPLPWRLSIFTRLKAGMTLLNESVNNLPASLRFFAGGDRSVRGYSYQSLGPKDESGNVIGGRHIFVGSLEIERALFSKWGVAAFYDIGNAFNSLSDIKFFQGAGIGVRYYTVVGPIRVDVARQIGVRDPKFMIHLSVGFEL